MEIDMNLPNKLTIMRIIMVPIFMLFLLIPLPLPDIAIRLITAILFLAASFTDMLDGKIARKRGLVTDFGKLMDPLADKFMVFGALIGILVYEGGIFRNIFAWAAAIVMFRELAVTSMRLLAAGKDGTVIAAKWIGKVKTVIQIICITTVLLEPILPIPFLADNKILSYLTIAAMSVMTVWSGIDYMYSYRSYFRQ